MESKKATNSQYSITVMSGSFLQRGEPALVDKWTRAKMAIDSGVDLVIELPTIYSCQSAEFFAYGAVSTLNSLGVVDFLSFGSENGDIKLITYIADVLLEEPEFYKNHLRSLLNIGNSFPKARNLALKEYFKAIGFQQYTIVDELLSNPNNILAIEYVKALKKINSKITPFAIKRIRSHYNSKDLTGSISSATAIREEIFKNRSLQTIIHTSPSQTIDYLNEFLKRFGMFNSIDNFTQIILYLLRSNSTRNISEILDIENGLENRIISCGSKYNSLSRILDCINTKRYTYTRLQRILIHLLLGINKDTFLRMHSYGPQYIRILGINKKGIELLSKIKDSSKLPIITKFSSFKKSDNLILKEMIEIDKRATDVYFTGLNHSDNATANLDFLTTPYIKK